MKKMLSLLLAVLMLLGCVSAASAEADADLDIAAAMETMKEIPLVSTSFMICSIKIEMGTKNLSSSTELIGWMIMNMKHGVTLELLLKMGPQVISQQLTSIHLMRWKSTSS